MSNLQTTPEVWYFILLSSHSLTISTKSKICLPPTKEFCNSKLSLSNTILNLLANTIDNNLYTLPTKLIGQKSLIFNILDFNKKQIVPYLNDKDTVLVINLKTVLRHIELWCYPANKATELTFSVHVKGYQALSSCNYTNWTKWNYVIWYYV